MKHQQHKALAGLGTAEIDAVVGGGIPGMFKAPQAQDMWGNTMSMEDWMNRQIAVANGGGRLNPHDFYDKGFDPDKPNIYTDN